jgi:hypothetical protein
MLIRKAAAVAREMKTIDRPQPAPKPVAGTKVLQKCPTVISEDKYILKKSVKRPI